MFSRILVINIFLAGLAVFLGLKTYGVWFPETEKSKGDRDVQGQSAWPAKTVIPRRMPPESAFRVVVDNNLFSPQREWLESEEPEPEPEITRLDIPGKKVVLHGVVILDGYERALVKNPRPKAGERPSKWVKVGDTIGDFKVTRIKKDRIVLAEGAKRFEVLLYDKEQPKVRGGVAREAKPTVVTTEAKKSPPKPKISKRKEPTEGEYEEVITPFGKIKRRIK
ncbi:MAG: hypothetical protein KAV83_13030 [Desulfobacterales bacterium]|nr:hypothetical protein [Desulfobacterales bacterium]